MDEFRFGCRAGRVPRPPPAARRCPAAVRRARASPGLSRAGSPGRLMMGVRASIWPSSSGARPSTVCGGRRRGPTVPPMSVTTPTWGGGARWRGRGGGSGHHGVAGQLACSAIQGALALGPAGLCLRVVHEAGPSPRPCAGARTWLVPASPQSSACMTIGSTNSATDDRLRAKIWGGKRDVRGASKG